MITLDRVSLAGRIITGLLAVLLLAVLVIVPFLLNRMNSVIGEAEERELNALKVNLVNAIEAEAARASSLSALVAAMPTVQRSMAEQQRDPLATEFVPGFADLRTQHGAAQFQFHLPPATSFLRVHRPEKFGDDLSGFRKTIIATNRDQRPISGLERGVAGLGIRGLAPVFSEGQHVGSVELGLSFGQYFFDSFLEQYGAGAALRLIKDDGFETFASTLGDAPLLSTAALMDAVEGGKPIENHQFNGKPVAILGSVIKDFSGQPIGVLEISLDRSSYIARAANARNAALFISVITLIAGLVMAVLVARSISRPIVETANAMREISQGDGDLTMRLDDSGNHELSELSRQFNAFVTRMQDTLLDVRDSADRVLQTADTIAASSQELAARSDEAAASLEETSAAVEEITATVASGAESARQASAMSSSTAEAVQLGNSSMEELRTTMEDIQAAASRVTDILTLIDSVAFQTNILALNASVEAARAGEQGRGFAVVANEVRALAERSKDAAREIRDVTDQSVAASHSGIEKVASVGEAMSSIMERIEQVNHALNAISEGSREQSISLGEVSSAVTQLDSVTQQNSSMVNENASSVAEMRNLAEQLDALLATFKLDEQEKANLLLRSS
ncbi:MAG: methyl-accepting chemotaxis protein [Halieaceae bacterium]|jgi:methyl-accepting chemotaxis protein|nr:methyl-accepting chemotaxis protein [Halieaceae bacterium]